MPMKFGEAEKRIKRLNKDEKSGKIKNKQIKNNLVQSYYNQVKLSEGEGGVKAMSKVIHGEGAIWTTIPAKDWERIFGGKK